MGEGSFVQVGLKHGSLIGNTFHFQRMKFRVFQKQRDHVLRSFSAVFQWVEDLCHAGAGSYHCLLILRECKLFSIIKLAVFARAFTESLVSGINYFFNMTF